MYVTAVTIVEMRQMKDIGMHVALVCICLLNGAIQDSQGGHSQQKNLEKSGNLEMCREKSEGK